MPDLLRTINRLKILVDSGYLSMLEEEWLNDAVTLLEDYFRQRKEGLKNGEHR